MKNIAIFASGSGSNAEEIMKHFQRHPHAQVALVISNNASAYVLERAKKFHIKSLIFSRQKLVETSLVDEVLKTHHIDFIVLAGFMLLFPVRLIRKFPDKILNIHPALLPKYGGKGMYGMHVHQAVVDNRENETGITIHMVNEKYDEGRIIFQATCAVDPSDTPDDVAKKVHQLEYAHYPVVIEGEIKKLIST